MSASDIPEPTVVYPEEEFERALVAVVRGVLTSDGRRYALVPRFGLDVAVVLEGSSAPATVRLFEVKAFNLQRQGGVRFGNQKGAGAQIELLLCGDDSLDLFQSVVRWAYVDGTRDRGTARYGLFTCEVARDAAMGTVRRGKQNNLSVAKLRASLVGWKEFCSQVRTFLLA